MSNTSCLKDRTYLCPAASGRGSVIALCSVSYAALAYGYEDSAFQAGVEMLSTPDSYYLVINVL
ncbi:hypothetical protein D0T84_09770 [Dysgonomonas sp. 521]|uniref:hypothetical protein n=1 Tax=Dysgonomonas sp. 521 TaxID=2302932 RepID=UPI0013D53F38|nr:hypothetical protein [Dysgonomonas sp. 521]NDV95206.1 hypothetical protein [Dysgonomonas sp. 521]